MTEHGVTAFRSLEDFGELPNSNLSARHVPQRLGVALTRFFGILAADRNSTNLFLPNVRHSLPTQRPCSSRAPGRELLFSCMPKTLVRALNYFDVLNQKNPYLSHNPAVVE